MQRQKPCSCSFCCSCALPPLALRRSLDHAVHTGNVGIGWGGMGIGIDIGIGIGTTCFGDIGRSGFAVGYLPATATASGLAKKPARLPYSSPNAKNTSKSCTPKPVGWRHCSTWTKQHKRQAQAKPRTEYMPLTVAPQTAGERLLCSLFSVDDFRGFTGHSQKRS
jgi:hypothetical protein